MIKIVELQTYDFSYLAASGTETRTVIANVDMGRYKTGRLIVTAHNANIVANGGDITFTARSVCPNQGQQFPFGTEQTVTFDSGTTLSEAGAGAVATMGPAVQIQVTGTQAANTGPVSITVSVYWQAWET